MDQHRTRIVVGEGQTLRKGLLRFVLEGEGYDVVAEAGSSAELARMVAVHEPDVVVLDDGIGATAVQMARELAPKAKVILVWPGAVVPIGGDARVEPAEVLKELGGAVEKVTARPAPTTETFTKPAWVDRVRKDPATLRDLLEKSGGLPRRPSVTELQRRGQRLHPVVPQPDEGQADERAPAKDAADAQAEADRTSAADDTRAETPAASSQPSSAPEAPPAPDDVDRPAAPVVILPVPGAGRTDEPILVVDAGTEPSGALTPPDSPEREAVAPSSTTPSEREDRGAAVVALPTPPRAADDPAAEWNRRLGTIALGGAAVAGALVLALSLGGSRIPADVLAADPPFVAGADAPQPFDGGAGLIDPDGVAGPLPGAPTLAALPVVVGDTTPTRDETTPPTPVPPPDDEEPEPPTPPEEPEPPAGVLLPGASERNRHGGPPGITGDAPDTPADDGGAGGNGNGGTDGNGNGGGNGNGPGNGNGNGPPSEPPGQGQGHGPGGVSGRAVPGHAHKR